MDADYNPTVDRSFGLGVQRKKKKKSKFAQAVEKKKPVFDPSKKKVVHQMSLQSLCSLIFHMNFYIYVK